MSQAMEKESTHGTSDEEPQKPVQNTAFKMVICEKCGKRMLVEVSEVSRSHRCPVCKVSFRTTWQDGILTVVFEEN